jgi:hypothetical protein
MIENIKPAEALIVADFKAHPVWEFLNDDEIGETMVRPVEKLPVETLDDRIVGTQVRLANGLEVWGLFGNFDVKNPRLTQHILALSIERDGESNSRKCGMRRQCTGWTSRRPRLIWWRRPTGTTKIPRGNNAKGTPDV